MTVKSSQSTGFVAGTVEGQEARAFIDQLREENEKGFGPLAYPAIQQLLAAGLHHPWMYIYELTQNACDAGARTVSWQEDGETITFQHDGLEPLCEKSIRALSVIGGTTKGLAALGFMGVGFKSLTSPWREFS